MRKTMLYIVVGHSIMVLSKIKNGILKNLRVMNLQ